MDFRSPSAELVELLMVDLATATALYYLANDRLHDTESEIIAQRMRHVTCQCDGHSNSLTSKGLAPKLPRSPPFFLSTPFLFYFLTLS
jgi:hypothetical protein